MRQIQLLLFLILLFPGTVCCQLYGKVVAITDGDTFTILDSTNQQIKIRLHGIDSPEDGQPFSNVSKKFLSDMIYSKQVKVFTSNKDRFGRTIGIVLIGNIVVNEEMLAKGMAWHFKQYDNRLSWAMMEIKAREEKIGLWKDENPIPPWKWRKAKKKSGSKSSFDY